MNETEWLKCTDIERMLKYLRGEPKQGLFVTNSCQRASDRKLRLFAVACCRRIWHLLIEESSRTAVTTLEQFVDDPTMSGSLIHAANEALFAVSDDGSEDNLDVAHYRAARAAYYAAHWSGAAVYHAALDASTYACEAVFFAESESIHAKELEGASQCPLLRCIFSPFYPVTMNKSSLSPLVIGLAKRIFEEHDFGRLPELASDLVEAGCTDENILTHCRSKGPHVRGCWVVDLLLGKE